MVKMTDFKSVQQSLLFGLSKKKDLSVAKCITGRKAESFFTHYTVFSCSTLFMYEEETLLAELCYNQMGIERTRDFAQRLMYRLSKNYFTFEEELEASYMSFFKKQLKEESKK